MNAVVGELVFDAPTWLWGLAAAAPLWWWFSRAHGAVPAPTGSLELWRSIAPPEAHAARRELRFSPRVLCIVAALALLVVGLSQPRLRTRAGPVTWRVVFDASEGPAVAGADGVSRGAQALARAKTMLARHAAPRDRVLWQALSGVDVLETRDTFPADWPRPEWARAGLPPPRWERFDEPGVLWVSDELAPKPSHAGVCVAARSSAEGVVASWPGARLALRSGALQLEAARAPRALLSGSGAGAIADAVGAWARARGVELARAADGGAYELEIDFGGAGERGPVRAARDGWQLVGAARVLQGERAASQVWLQAADDPALTLVRWSRGRVECAFDASARLEGDGAAFAVAWAELFDRALLSSEGATALAALSADSPARESTPQPPPQFGGRSRLLGRWLALAAALCALAAVWARR